MADKTTICNMALSRIGVSQFIGNITENSNEARVCRVFFDPMRDFALRDYPWSFARREVALAALSGVLPSVWTYKYLLPSDCLMARAVTISGLTIYRAEQRIKYELGNEAATQGDIKVLYTTVADAILIYTKRVTDTELFDPLFVSALSYLLASEIAFPLSVKPEIAKQARDAYVLMSSRAAAVNMNEAQEGTAESEPEAIAYRNG